jgi:hypothetical protein
MRQCVIKLKGLRDEYLMYKKLGVKTRFVYLYFQKMDQILGKSQEIPNFELTNSVSDDSSGDTVDKCDQIGVVVITNVTLWYLFILLTAGHLL